MDLLLSLARRPHDEGSWLGHGHCIAHGNPPTPFAEGTRLSATLVVDAPASLSLGFAQLATDRGPVRFYLVVPLHDEEMRYQQQHGTDALMERVLGSEHIVVGPIDPGRPSVVR
ncbi:MAG: suppressor of fused domain protein [Armatimonadetes bacterium]|nr:suppressor of fused domain protein [Armatimonadota bacterium]